jgi:regulator of RNase E activity RraA
MTMSATQVLETLQQTTIASLATVLRQHGLRNVWLQGPRPIRDGLPRIVGPAFTLRFVPAREDMATAESIRGPHSVRAAIESMPAGCVVVADANGLTHAGAFGDITCARMRYRNVCGLVTDGAVRDLAGVRQLDWPVWACGTAAPPSLAQLHFVDSQVLIGCAGVAVCPDDLIVADDDGAIVIPAAVARSIAETAREKDQFEEWILGRVKEGEPLGGLYPPDEATRARFAAEIGRG